MTLPVKAARAPCPDRVEVRPSRIHGQGVFALRELRAGQAIGTYAGRRYPAGAMREARNDRVTYLFVLSDGSMIDGAQGGNATRHLNHSCVPNVEALEEPGPNGQLKIVFRALRRIRAGEELFLDYELQIDGDDPAQYPCACRAETCRGTMAALGEGMDPRRST